MYKIIVSYRLLDNRTWSADISVFLPLNPDSVTTYDLAIAYVNSQVKLLGADLKVFWGTIYDDSKASFRTRTMTLKAFNLDVLKQQVEREIFNIKLIIYRVVTSYTDNNSQSPGSYTLDIDPATLIIEGTSSETNKKLTYWQAIFQTFKHWTLRIKS